MGSDPIHQSVASLEMRLKPYGEARDFERVISAFPLAPQWWHKAFVNAAVYGSGILSRPPRADDPGDEYSRCFNFYDPDTLGDAWATDGFRLGEYYPLGQIDFGNWIVYVHQNGVSAAVLDHEYVADTAWETRMRFIEGGLVGLLSELNLQTVSCFLHPESHSRYSLVEVFNGNTVVYGHDYESPDGDWGTVEFDDQEQMWGFYFEFVERQARTGHQLHYCPVYLRDRILEYFR